MYISHETPSQIQTRLRRVVAAADLVWYDGPYAFYELPKNELGLDTLSGALAAVADDEVWSILKSADRPATETFAVFSFHFQDGLDNSGFVGWLASELKRRLGTGVFVVCGQNSRRGGIFDYWGVPVSMRDLAAQAIDDLRASPVEDNRGGV
ncbi:DUF6196 family protein [Lysobacter gummosus]|uniref:DUF6196 family protein n=1 Tax=Lysobacter gummosus TaxID=262324 RepID=A0ABY3XK34_9GAMM|nr:DUF6196 family protein [Lysobacter gummosus]ALN91645.1 hypothetical protein LG3211_2678 [Lysobacter gummosus]UNP31990.1 DUF6196 family protein [Lysobacter gummosus]